MPLICLALLIILIVLFLIFSRKKNREALRMAGKPQPKPVVKMGPAELRDVVANNSSIVVIKKALGRLHDMQALHAEIFEDDGTIGGQRDNAGSSWLALNSGNELHRQRAAREVSNEAISKHLAWNDSSKWVRMAGVGKIKNQDDLREIISRHPCLETREAAVKAMNDDEFLAKVALGNEFRLGLREAAVQRLGSNHLLLKILQSDSPGRVRSGAVRAVTEQAPLIDLALKDPAEDVRMYAAKRVESSQAIMQIIRNDSSQIVKTWALGAPCNLTDEFLAEAILRCNLSDAGKESAINRFAGAANLKKLAAEMKTSSSVMATLNRRLSKIER